MRFRAQFFFRSLWKSRFGVGGRRNGYKKEFHGHYIRVIDWMIELIESRPCNTVFGRKVRTLFFSSANLAEPVFGSAKTALQIGGKLPELSRTPKVNSKFEIKTDTFE